MMEKGQILDIQAVDMGSEGEGIGRWEGMAVFMPGAVKGDTATVRITKVKKSYALSQVIEIKEASPLRRGAFSCAYFERGCGGCGFGALGYEAQLGIKEAQVREKIRRIGKVSDPTVRSIIGMEDGDNDGGGFLRYRNKAQFQVRPMRSGEEREAGEDDGANPPAAVGFYRRKSRAVIDCADCLLQNDAAVAAANALRDFMERFAVPAWDPSTGRGLIRNLIVKSAANTKEVMAVTVINGKSIPHAEELIRAMDEAVYEAGSYLESFAINMNSGPEGEIMGGKTVIAAGKPTITDMMGDLKFEISPESFYQVNPVQAMRLYSKVRDYCGLTGQETVLDIYCGIGTIGLFCAKDAGFVIGIESVKEAVLDANRNAVINGVVNARYIEGKAEEVLPRYMGSSGDDELTGLIKKADAAVLDPPRSGCRPELLEAVAKASVKRIVYVSCDPATMARDIRILGELGYEFKEATPVDMFPNTGSVETVALLSRKK